MRYLLDTNICIALLNGTSPAARERLDRYGPGEVGVPAPAAYELYFGAFKSRRARQNLALLDSAGFEVLPFDVEDARVAGKVRSDLEAVGKTIGPVRPADSGSGVGSGTRARDREPARVRPRRGSDLRRLDQSRPRLRVLCRTRGMAGGDGLRLTVECRPCRDRWEVVQL